MLLQCLRHISKRFSIHLQRFIHIPRGIPGRDRVRNVMSSACYDRGTFLPTVMKDSMFLCRKSEKNHYCCLELFNCCNSRLVQIFNLCNCNVYVTFPKGSAYIFKGSSIYHVEFLEETESGMSCRQHVMIEVHFFPRLWRIKCSCVKNLRK